MASQPDRRACHLDPAVLLNRFLSALMLLSVRGVVQASRTPLNSLAAFPLVDLENVFTASFALSATGSLTAKMTSALVGIRSMPTLQVLLRYACLLFFLDRSLPGFIRLFCRLPIGALAGIIIRFLFAHGQLLRLAWTSASFANAFDLFIDVGIM
ncbi:MAG: hypothetical protein ABI192_07280 [Bradyrhizobium sp.]